MKVDVTWHGDAAKTAAKKGAGRGLFLAAEYILEKSRALVPIEEGTLERSGVASVDEGNLRAAVSYDTPYACRQHEELGWAHDAGRQAKYLETPLNSERGKVGEIVSREIKSELGA